jgi:hypothetical protein
VIVNDPLQLKLVLKTPFAESLRGLQVPTSTSCYPKVALVITNRRASQTIELSLFPWPTCGYKAALHGKPFVRFWDVRFPQPNENDDLLRRREVEA